MVQNDNRIITAEITKLNTANLNRVSDSIFNTVKSISDQVSDKANSLANSVLDSLNFPNNPILNEGLAIFQNFYCDGIPNISIRLDDLLAGLDFDLSLSLDLNPCKNRRQSKLLDYTYGLVNPNTLLGSFIKINNEKYLKDMVSYHTDMVIKNMGGVGTGECVILDAVDNILGNSGNFGGTIGSKIKLSESLNINPCLKESNKNNNTNETVFSNIIANMMNNIFALGEEAVNKMLDSNMNDNNKNTVMRGIAISLNDNDDDNIEGKLSIVNNLASKMPQEPMLVADSDIILKNIDKSSETKLDSIAYDNIINGITIVDKNWNKDENEVNYYKTKSNERLNVLTNSILSNNTPIVYDVANPYDISNYDMDELTTIAFISAM